MRRRALLAAGVLLPLAAAAQGFPERPVALVCPFPPGGPLDALLRTLAEPMARRLGQPVVIENRPGAAAGSPFRRASRPHDRTGMWSP